MQHLVTRRDLLSWEALLKAFAKQYKQHSFIYSLTLFNVEKTIVTSTNLHRKGKIK